MSSDVFRVLCDGSPLPIGLFRVAEGDTGAVCEYANEALLRLVGVERAAPRAAGLQQVERRLLASNFADYMTICRQRGTAHRFSLAWHGGAWHGGDSPEATCVATVQRVPDGCVGISIELSRATLEEGLAAEDLWRALAENPTDYFVVVARDGTFLYVNQTAEGIRMEDVVGRAKIFDYTAEVDHPTIREALEAAFEHGRVTTWESYVPVVDHWFTNVMRPVSRAGVPYAACLTAKQITAQKTAEIALRQSEAQLRSLAENAPDQIVLTDLERRALYANHSVSGQSVAEVVGRQLEELAPAERRAELVELFAQVQDHGAPRNYRSESPTPMGVRTFESRIGAVREAGEVVGFVVITSDITERIQLQNEMVHASRMAMLGELAAGVGHEINNPLMLIRVVSELVRDDIDACLGTGSTTVGQLDRLDHAVDRIAKIVGGLRGLARAPEEAHPFEVHRSIQGALSFVEGLFDFHRLTLHLQLQAAEDRVLGDEAGFQQVILNLLANARDAVIGRTEPRVEIVTYNEGAAVVVEVRDNGPGVPEKLRGTLFDAFTTTKRARGGTGLGLAVSRSIVERMRGELSVCSSSGCGAAFRVRLPLTGHLDRPASTEAPELGALCGSLLLVDDEPMILSVLKLSLEKLGVEVTTASRSTDALELLRSRRFDYLITDRQMPDLSGEDLIRRASPYLVDTDCFLLSGWFSPDEEVGGLKEIGDKAVRLIGKPVVRADLARYLTRKSPS